jgi:hypothetical protein
MNTEEARMSVAYHQRWFSTRKVILKEDIYNDSLVTLKMSFVGEYPHRLNLTVEDSDEQVPNLSFPASYNPHPSVYDANSFFENIEKTYEVVVPEVFKEETIAFLTHHSQSFTFDIYFDEPSNGDDSYKLTVFYFPEFEKGNGDFLYLSASANIFSENSLYVGGTVSETRDDITKQLNTLLAKLITNKEEDSEEVLKINQILTALKRVQPAASTNPKTPKQELQVFDLSIANVLLDAVLVAKTPDELDMVRKEIAAYRGTDVPSTKGLSKVSSSDELHEALETIRRVLGTKALNRWMKNYKLLGPEFFTQKRSPEAIAELAKKHPRLSVVYGK